MAREVIYETLWTKTPGQERLRKSAEGRVKALLRDGWHEMGRETVGPDTVRIRFERELANRPLPPLRRVPEPPPRRTGDRGRGGDRGRRTGSPGPAARGVAGGGPGGAARGAPRR
ncbi:MAG TPA: hypothetical protein VG709_08290 [Actinomycetota bacterium]|nr:hypothetical protein [Actinomycetota bacterium]